MELTYICKQCGGKSKLPVEAFSNADAIICPLCGKASGNTVDSSQEPVKRFRDDLNVEQEQAATYDGSAANVLVLAGAGCGKTRTMIARAMFLLRSKHIAPERIAMLTFTRRAAREIHERISKELPLEDKRIFVGTFHAFCLTLLHRYPLFFNLENVKIMDRNDQDVIVRRCRSEVIHLLGTNAKAMPSEKSILSAFSYINNACMTLQQFFEKKNQGDFEALDSMKMILERYIAYKRQNGYLDFDDILTLVSNSLRDNADFRRIVQNSYDHILVDEMQDTSPVQWQILENITPPIHLFCVGDDAQSIYSFRGADFESIHHFCDRLPDSIILKLTENYRSTQQILDLANLLMEESPFGYDKNLKAVKGDGVCRPTLMEFDSEEKEAKTVCNMIAAKLEEGIPPKEIIVLLRSAMTGRMLEMALREYGIDYRLIGGMGFLQASHVKDVVAAFEAVATAQNEISLIRFVSLFPRLGEKAAEKIYDLVKDVNLPKERLRIIGNMLMPKNFALGDFLINRLDLDKGPGEIIRQLVAFFDETGILETKYDKWKERRRDLDVLISVAERHSSPEAFLEAFKLDPDAEVREMNHHDDVVTLITVHSAKGTEAEVCFVLRVQDGLYPHSRSESEAEIEEDRRVLYVALTRAKKELYLTVTSTRGRNSWCSYTAEPSSFLTPQMLALMKKSRKHR